MGTQMIKEANIDRIKQAELDNYYNDGALCLGHPRTDTEIFSLQLSPTQKEEWNEYITDETTKAYQSLRQNLTCAFNTQVNSQIN